MSCIEDDKQQLELLNRTIDELRALGVCGPLKPLQFVVCGDQFSKRYEEYGSPKTRTLQLSLSSAGVQLVV
jgi:hypothetical protein